MRHFLGYPSFTNEIPFNASLFVEIRKNLGLEVINEINEKIVAIKTRMGDSKSKKDDDSDSDNNNKGRVIMNATACP
jgi:IS5 family transposase